MKALFLTTKTADCLNHVRAWEAYFGTSVHVMFNHEGIRTDHVMTESVKKEKPDVVFYIGAMKGSGVPWPDAFREMRLTAPVVNLCSDAADRPWHPVLEAYTRLKCFDLQVSIDGAEESPVDFTTLTPVDYRPFTIDVEKDIRFGFSGSVGRWNGRSEIIKSLEWLGDLTVSHRAVNKEYADHARFMKRCKMILNVSATGSGHRNHIKGRVVEAGHANCVLLEDAESPIGNWYPEGTYLTYHDVKEADDIVKNITDAEIKTISDNFNQVTREKYSAKAIYGSILRRLHGSGRGAIKQKDVDFTKQITTP